jgi:hypothetical protein
LLPVLHALPLPHTPTHAQEKKCFDSADWALAKEGKKQQPGAIEPALGPVPDVHHASKLGASHLKPSSGAS